MEETANQSLLKAGSQLTDEISEPPVELRRLPPRKNVLNSKSFKKQSTKKLTSNIEKVFAQPSLVRGIMQKKHTFKYTCSRCQKGFNKESYIQQHSQTQCDRQLAFAERQRAFKKADYF